MTYDYIKRVYSFQPEVGKHVRHTVTGKNGTITPDDPGQGHYVQVRFFGKAYSLPCHPEELVYEPELQP